MKRSGWRSLGEVATAVVDDAIQKSGGRQEPAPSSGWETHHGCRGSKRAHAASRNSEKAPVILPPTLAAGHRTK